MSNVKAVARALLEKAAERGIPVTNIKLQKLLYFAHGLFLARHGKPLITGEQFQAWKYGPVLESLYHNLKMFGPAPILPENGFIPNWPSLRANPAIGKTLDDVLDQLGSASNNSLIAYSHHPRGPWHAVFKENTKSISIEDAAIQKYFKTIVKD